MQCEYVSLNTTVRGMPCHQIEKSKGKSKRNSKCKMPSYGLRLIILVWRKQIEQIDLYEIHHSSNLNDRAYYPLTDDGPTPHVLYLKDSICAVSRDSGDHSMAARESVSWFKAPDRKWSLIDSQTTSDASVSKLIGPTPVKWCRRVKRLSAWLFTGINDVNNVIFQSSVHPQE